MKSPTIVPLDGLAVAQTAEHLSVAAAPLADPYITLRSDSPCPSLHLTMPHQHDHLL